MRAETIAGIQLIKPLCATKTKAKLREALVSAPKSAEATGHQGQCASDPRALNRQGDSLESRVTCRTSAGQGPGGGGKGASTNNGALKERLWSWASSAKRRRRLCSDSLMGSNGSETRSPTRSAFF